jgi:signal transduction histidine kinase
MQKGIKLLEKHKAVSLQSAFDNYGVLFHQLGNEDSALFYYEKALNLKKENGNIAGLPYSMQKIAMAKTSKGAFEAALLILSEALEISKQVQDTLLICETYTYYGDVYMAKRDFRLAANSYEKALTIAKDKKYTYLVNYIYGELPDVYQELGEPDKAFQFLKESQIIKDSALNLERVRSIAELEMVFETTQKEQKIQLLEQDIQISKLKTLQQRRVVIGIILLLLMITALLALIMNRQKLQHKTAVLEQKERLQKERLVSVIMGEEKERERVARELHDGLGQLLSAAKMHISSLEEDVAPELQPYLQNSIQLVDQACNEVREISHALLPKKLISGHLELTLNELSNTINAGHKIAFHLILNTGLTEIKNQKAVAIFRIIQELVNNTLKHSNADKIELKVDWVNEMYSFQYVDNGQHFKKSMIESGKGIGWKNIFSRIEIMEGTIVIEDKNGAMETKILFV